MGGWDLTHPVQEWFLPWLVVPRASHFTIITYDHFSELVGHNPDCQPDSFHPTKTGQQGFTNAMAATQFSSEKVIESGYMTAGSVFVQPRFHFHAVY